MFISGTERDKKINANTATIYLAFTAFCGLFSSVYGKFSHGVSSDYMVFLCLIPFVGGVVPYTLLRIFNFKAPMQLIRQVYNCGVATLGVGSCIKGIFDIYGSECVYTPYYFYLGIILCVVAIISYLIRH